jgi:hypothetical protein
MVYLPRPDRFLGNLSGLAAVLLADAIQSLLSVLAQSFAPSIPDRNRRANLGPEVLAWLEHVSDGALRWTAEHL